MWKQIWTPFRTSEYWIKFHTGSSSVQGLDRTCQKNSRYTNLDILEIVSYIREHITRVLNQFIFSGSGLFPVYFPLAKRVVLNCTNDVLVHSLTL